jgi:hypothetical protein
LTTRADDRSRLAAEAQPASGSSRSAALRDHALVALAVTDDAQSVCVQPLAAATHLSTARWNRPAACGPAFDLTSRPIEFARRVFVWPLPRAADLGSRGVRDQRENCHGCSQRSKAGHRASPFWRHLTPGQPPALLRDVWQSGQVSVAAATSEVARRFRAKCNSCRRRAAHSMLHCIADGQRAAEGRISPFDETVSEWKKRARRPSPRPDHIPQTISCARRWQHS